MRWLRSRELPPCLFGLLCTLGVLALSWGTPAEATDSLFQTVPTRTPAAGPPTSPTGEPALPQIPGAEDGDEGLASGLELRLDTPHQDVLPGEQLLLRIRVANQLGTAATDVSLVVPLDPVLEPLRVSATQGSVDVRNQSVTLYLGTLEIGQAALMEIEVRVGDQAVAGQVLLTQADTYYSDGKAVSNVLALGLPPGILPATGADRGVP